MRFLNREDRGALCADGLVPEIAMVLCHGLCLHPFSFLLASCSSMYLFTTVTACLIHK